MRPTLARLALASSMLLACNNPAPEGTKTDAPVAAVTTPEAPTPPAGDVKAPETTPPPTDSKTTPAGEEPTPADAQAAPTTGAPAEPPAADPAADPAAAAAAAAAAAGEAKTKLLTEAKAKKTTDAKAKKALEEAEKAGATPRELAEAANARGQALFDDPERAAAFFTWAKDKDTTYPDPVFNLAKQSANAGEIPQTVELLKEVSKRGGKTLLKQVGFDPTFEIVKDDPEVQKLIK